MSSASDAQSRHRSQEGPGSRPCMLPGQLPSWHNPSQCQGPTMGTLYHQAAAVLQQHNARALCRHALASDTIRAS